MFQAVTEQEVQEWVTAIQVRADLLFYSFQYDCVALFSSTIHLETFRNSYFSKNIFAIVIFWGMMYGLIGSCTGIQIEQSGLEHSGQGHSVMHVLGQDIFLSQCVSLPCAPTV